jgi:hypothetical protein
MRVPGMLPAVCMLVGLSSHLAAAPQHDGHQAVTPSSRQATADPSECARAQPIVARIVDAAMTRLEKARQTNSPADMRAAIDDLQSALRDLRSQLAPCAALQTPTAHPHAGQTTPPSRSGYGRP